MHPFSSFSGVSELSYVIYPLIGSRIPTTFILGAVFCPGSHSGISQGSNVVVAGAAVVVCSGGLQSPRQVLPQSSVTSTCTFPYIPGSISFITVLVMGCLTQSKGKQVL